ncbi:hypothetical protein MVEG_05389 [Podila verticillata NRRL 6337]|nr:hypothetical protein MVEG_05389 [Podila verticillata NRRL 6337]
MFRPVESATGLFQKVLSSASTRTPAGEWWELFDDIHNLPYYYNTKTGQTEWEKPQDSANIISLTAIQKSVIGQRLSLHLSTAAALSPQDQLGSVKDAVERLKIGSSTCLAASSLASPTSTNSPELPTETPISATTTPTETLTETPKVQENVPELATRPTKPKVRAASSVSFFSKSPTSSEPSPDLSPPISPTKGASGFKESGTWRKQKDGSTNSFVSTFQRAASMTLSRHSINVSQPIAMQGSFRPKSSVASTPSAPLSTSNPPPTGPNKLNGGAENFLQPARKSFQIAERARKFGIGAPIANDEAARKMSPMIMEQQQEALRKMTVSPPPTSRKLGTRGPGGSPDDPSPPPRDLSDKTLRTASGHPVLPAELQSSISQFRIAGFAQKYFSTHKKGLFRRKVPMEKMLLHQKSPLSQPLMVLNKRGVQKDALRCFKIIQKLMGERKGNGYVGPTGVELGETCVDLSIQSEDDIKLVLELIKKGLDHGELRDEIYVQMCKQLTENPSREGSIKGWHLFTILLITFSPSKNLHDYLASFLTQHATSALHPIPVMAQHCNDLLRRISKRGSRAKQLTLVEIARAQEAAFRPSVFEATLERLMGRQMAAGGEWAAWRVPRLMVFLKESVINLGGLHTEGIFRISGDLGAVAELRARIELGNYDISGISDPHVPCSLLRLWIRDLPEPVIPYDMYQLCIQGAQDKDAVARIVNSLPMWHKEMIIYLVSFLKTFNNATVRESTKMSLSNLAMVFAPTLLQCSSDDAPMLMGHLQAERTFVSTLISEVELTEDGLCIVGESTPDLQLRRLVHDSDAMLQKLDADIVPLVQ